MTSNAPAQRDNSPSAIVARYAESYASVLPSQIKPETFVRVTQSALKRGKRATPGGPTDLEQAAANDMGVFLGELMKAAQLGLEPGTPQFWLVPRRNGKGKPPTVLGIIGYEGMLDLIYRTGAVSSVTCEVVRQSDHFDYNPAMRVPDHRPDWFARDEERGPMVGVYAYAQMRDGSTSKVVILNRDDIARIRRSSDSAGSDYSPWAKHEKAMWMKSAVRQLFKWVPKSAEFRTLTVKAERVGTDLADEGKATRAAVGAADTAGIPSPPQPQALSVDEAVDAEYTVSPEEEEAGAQEQQPDGNGPATSGQIDRIRQNLSAGWGMTDDDEVLATCSEITGRTISAFGDITATDANLIIGSTTQK